MKTTEKEKNVVVAVLAIAGVLWLLSLAPAGDLKPPSAPGSTMHTLDEIYNLYASPPAGFIPSVDRGTSHIYMKVEGIDGESQEQYHQKWCEVASFKQGHMVPADVVVGSTRRGDAVFEDVVVVKPIDKASPKLAEAVCRGDVFPKVEIHVTGSYDGSGPVKYYAYELLNVLITGCAISGSGQSEDVPTEEVSFAFKEIKVTYTETDDAGSSKGNVEYQWTIEPDEI